MPNSDPRTAQCIGPQSVRYAATAMRRIVLEEIVVTARAGVRWEGENYIDPMNLLKLPAWSEWNG